MLIYGQRHHLALWPALDALTPFLAIMAIGLGLSHLAAGTAFGIPTDVPWAVELWNAKRHPTQIYETLASLLTFCLLWFKKPGLQPGLDFLTFVAMTTGWQLLIGGFRSSNTLIFNGLHQDQVAAWAVLAACFILYEFRLKQIE
jgi:phosphatidylglycerol:prolipoprotein diacylglycerol transferase